MSGNPMFDPSTWLPERPQRSRRSFVPARGADAQSDVFAHRPKSQVFVMMDPKEYLRLTTPPDQPYEELGKEEVVAALEARMEADLPIDPAYLRVDLRKNRVVGQEGRHRAWAAIRLGLPAIPVVVFVHDGLKYVDLTRRRGFVLDLARVRPQTGFGPIFSGPNLP